MRPTIKVVYGPLIGARRGVRVFLGQFYTPASVVKVLVEVLAPHQGRVFDPCCGSGGMFVQSEKFIEVHGGKVDDISIYDQEATPTRMRITWGKDICPPRPGWRLPPGNQEAPDPERWRP